jgi:predicted aconitase with swiveling domain
VRYAYPEGHRQEDGRAAIAEEAEGFVLVQALIGRLPLFVADRRRVVEEWETIARTHAAGTRATALRA